METSIILSGFGGQGALFAGQLLAYAAMDNGYQVTWFPSYGPEMRGGTAHCTVIISNEQVGAPIVANPDVALVFNGPSFEKYEQFVTPGGLLVVNSSICNQKSKRVDIDQVLVPANEIAEEFGSTKMLNMAMLGAMTAVKPILPLEAIVEALFEHLPSNKSHLLDNNVQVLRSAYKVGLGIQVL